MGKGPQFYQWHIYQWHQDRNRGHPQPGPGPAPGLGGIAGALVGGDHWAANTGDSSHSHLLNGAGSSASHHKTPIPGFYARPSASKSAPAGASHARRDSLARATANSTSSIGSHCPADIHRLANCAASTRTCKTCYLCCARTATTTAAHASRATGNAIQDCTACTCLFSYAGSAVSTSAAAHASRATGNAIQIRAACTGYFSSAGSAVSTSAAAHASRATGNAIQDCTACTCLFSRVGSTGSATATAHTDGATGNAIQDRTVSTCYFSSAGSTAHPAAAHAVRVSRAADINKIAGTTSRRIPNAMSNNRKAVN